MKMLKKSAISTLVAAAAVSGLSVLPAHADAPAAHSSTAVTTVARSHTTAGHRQATLKVDNVTLTVTSPDLPEGQAYTAAPGDSMQVATIQQDNPFRSLTVRAVPFGETLPETGFPISRAADAAAWRQSLHGTAGPEATLFGQKVPGVVLRSTIPGMKGHDTAVESVVWVVVKDGRTWVVTLGQDRTNLRSGFGTQLTVIGADTKARTTVDVAALAASKAEVNKTAKSVSPQIHMNNVALGGNLGQPSWWSSTCDGNGSPLSSSGTFMGLEVCGGGSNVLESVPGVSQYEWQCAELSDRYLVQRYGLTGPGGNGNQEAAKWYNAYPSTFDLYNSGDATPPVAGDVISFGVGGTGVGHTGVVYNSTVNSSGNGTVYFVDENWTGDNGYHTVTVTNWTIPDITGQGGTVQWIHNPNDGTPTQPSTEVAFNASGSNLLYTRDSSGTLVNTDEGIDPATSPSIAKLTDGSYEVAWRASGSGLLYLRNSNGTLVNTNEGVAAGTSPAITALPNGAYVVAFNANGSNLLYTRTSSGVLLNTEEGVAAGTSPVIAAQSGGSYEVAFNANGSNLLYTRDSSGALVNTSEGMASGTSPAITALSDGSYEVAFNANGGLLYTRNSTGALVNTNEGVAAGTSPAIAAQSGGSYEVAFNANGSNLLYTRDSSGALVNTSEGMASGTSPAITTQSDGTYEVAFNANGGLLYTRNSTGALVNTAEGVQAGTSPAIAAQ